MSNQIETQIDVSLTERNRLTALFRLVLVVPMAIFIASFTAAADLSSDDASYFMVGLISLPVALAIVFRQIYPSYVLSFNEALLTDEYPSIEENDVVSVTFPEVDAKALNRWLPLIKWFIAIPLYLVGIFYAIYALFLTLFGWLSILFTGNYPEICAEGIVGTIAYWNRVVGYALLLVTDEYPTFSL